MPCKLQFEVDNQTTVNKLLRLLLNVPIPAADKNSMAISLINDNIPDGSGRSKVEGGLMSEISLRTKPYSNSVAIAIF